MQNNKSKTYYFKNAPLRGEVELQSDPNISCFLATFASLIKKECKIDGTFISGSYTENYIQSLVDSGLLVGSSTDRVSVSEDQDCFDSCFLDNCDILGFYKILITLSKKGMVEVAGNNDFIGLLKYMGYYVEQKTKNISIVFNKTVESRESLTFHETNLTYFFVSILIFILSCKKFAISIPNISYEISLLIDLFKEHNLIEDVIYGNFVTIHFNLEALDSTEFLNLQAPKDSEELIFWAFATLATGGEIRINGLSSNTVISTLKILSDVGAGFESLSDKSLKIWGKVDSEKLKNVVISDSSSHLIFTKLCLLSLLSNSIEGPDVSVKFNLDTEKFKNTILDFNRLGSSIKIDTVDTVEIFEGKIKSGTVYLEENQEETAYANIIFAICSDGKVGIKNIDCVSFYNNNLVSKLLSLGANIKEL